MRAGLNSHLPRYQLSPAMAMATETLLNVGLLFSLALFFPSNMPVDARTIKYNDEVAPVVKNQGFLCSECLGLSEQAEKFLSDPDNLDAAKKFVKTYACAALSPSDIKDKCIDMVDEYVPTIFDALQEQLAEDKLCMQTGLCIALDLSIKRDHTCAMCQEFASDCSNVLSNNKTHNMAIVHNTCDKYNVLQNECVALLDAYMTYRSLGTSFSDKDFCGGLKLCQSIKAPRANNCVLCQYIVLELKTKLKDPKTQERIKEFLLDTCKKVPNHADECQLLVLEYTPIIFASIGTYLNLDLCTKIGICPSQDLMARFQWPHMVVQQPPLNQL